MKIIYFTFLLFFLALGCSENKVEQQEVMISPHSLKIMGDAGEYFKISNVKGKVGKCEDMLIDWEAKVQLTRTDKKEEGDGFHGYEAMNLQLYLDLTDENGMPITSFDGFWVDFEKRDPSKSIVKLNELLKAEEGETAWVTFYKDMDLGSQYKETLPDGISKFTITSKIVMMDLGYSDENYDDMEYQETDDGYGLDEGFDSSYDCDEALSEYESFVDDYIDMLEDAVNGDLTVMTRAASLMKKAESAGNKIQNIGQVGLGSSCWDRYLRIHQKLTDAAMNMTKNMPQNYENMQNQLENLDLEDLFPN